MKFYKKYLNPHHWLAFLRRQPKHMQHVYAVIFSAVVTSLLTSFVLYHDYGFWHERYLRSDSIITNAENNDIKTTESPKEMLGSFFSEASDRIKSLGVNKTDLLQEEEVYVQESTSTENKRKEE